MKPLIATLLTMLAGLATRDIHLPASASPLQGTWF
jgi:hypothetical protein